MEDAKIKTLQIHNELLINKFVHCFNKIHFTHWSANIIRHYGKELTLLNRLVQFHYG